MVLLEISNFLHFVGLAFGLGGSTIAAIISAKADKYKEVASTLPKIMPSIVKLIWIGIILLVVSGIALSYFIQGPLNRGMLIVKHVLVVWIIIFGFVIGVNSNKMRRLMPTGREKPSSLFIKSKNIAKVFSIINLMLWYIVTLVGVFV